MPPQDLSLRVEFAGEARIIHIAGELDLSNVTVLDAELERALSTTVVVVELSQCEFIDSSALRSLVQAYRAIDEAGGELVLVAPSQPVRRVLEVAALDQLMAVFGTVDEAVTSVA